MIGGEPPLDRALQPRSWPVNRLRLTFVLRPGSDESSPVAPQRKQKQQYRHSSFGMILAYPSARTAKNKRPAANVLGIIQWLTNAKGIQLLIRSSSQS